jgi:hypothetical protein
MSDVCVVRIAGALERVALAIEHQTAAVERLIELFTPPGEESGDCTHPEDQRVDLSRAGAVGKWYCRACGHRN